jgi:hypothetical protein
MFLLELKEVRNSNLTSSNIKLWMRIQALGLSISRR